MVYRRAVPMADWSDVLMVVWSENVMVARRVVLKAL
jgi:hypothetical protein